MAVKKQRYTILEFNINEKFYNDMLELQVLGVCLLRAVVELPESTVKQYLLGEVRRGSRLNGIDDFYMLRKKVSKIAITLSPLKGLDEILRLLNDIEDMINMLIGYIEAEVK